jgi:hypothetical protein
MELDSEFEEIRDGPGGSDERHKNSNNEAFIKLVIEHLTLINAQTLFVSGRQKKNPTDPIGESTGKKRAPAARSRQKLCSLHVKKERDTRSFQQG